MSRELPDDLVQRSLEETAKFAKTVLPLLKTACYHVAKDVENVPPGGARHPLVERQLAPALIRLRSHQMIQGHNSLALASGGAPLKTARIRNGAVCLMFQDCEFRLLKASKWHPTRPSGVYQERLINQARYWEMITNPNLFGDEPSLRPLLNGLIYYQLRQFELEGAYVVIPHAFHKGKVNVVAKMEIDLTSDDLDRAATFEGALNAQMGSDSIVVTTEELETPENPFAESEADEIEFASEMEPGSVLEKEVSEDDD